MAASKRNRARDDEHTRSKIRTTQLVNFLQTAALTGLDTGGQAVNPVRIQAAKILLDKSMSNAPTELAGTFDGKVEITHKLG